MEDRDFQFASAMFSERQRIIAAGKLQRWDVVKWTITVNIALAAGSIAFNNSASAAHQFFWLAVIIAVIGWVLMMYYNRRLTKTRNESLKTERYLADNGIDYSAIAGGPPTEAKWHYDREELFVFSVILFLSVFPTYAVWLLSPW
jgi:hypothetical protein